MRTFLEWMKLSESMSVYVQGHDYQSEVRDLDDVADQIKAKVVYPMWSRITPEEQDAVKKGGSTSHQTIVTDGSYISDGNLVINFYTAGWSDESIKRITDGIKYFLDEMKVKYGPFKQERSGMYKSNVIRIPVLKFDTTKNTPPLMNLANANAYLIFKELLGLEGDGSSFQVSPSDLLMRIAVAENKIDLAVRAPEVEREPGKATIYSGGYDAEQIADRLKTLEQIAQWAIDNHYDSIYVV